jgi:putative colanic acid biosynthesis acetyltransferase WcaF
VAGGFFLLRLFGAKVTPTAFVYDGARIWYPPNLELGANATIGARVYVYSAAKIIVGDHAIVSPGAFLCTAGHDIEDPHFQTVAAPITIGARAWVASEAFVGPGVTIGEGAVLGARGCAFRDLENLGRFTPAIQRASSNAARSVFSAVFEAKSVDAKP